MTGAAAAAVGAAAAAAPVEASAVGGCGWGITALGTVTLLFSCSISCFSDCFALSYAFRAASDIAIACALSSPLAL